jgi:hypothetical protein
MIAARRAKALAIRAASGAKRCMRDSPLNGLSTRQHPSQFEAANALRRAVAKAPTLARFLQAGVSRRMRCYPKPSHLESSRGRRPREALCPRGSELRGCDRELSKGSRGCQAAEVSVFCVLGPGGRRGLPDRGTCAGFGLAVIRSARPFRSRRLAIAAPQ